MAGGSTINDSRKWPDLFPTGTENPQVSKAAETKRYRDIIEANVKRVFCWGKSIQDGINL